MPKHSFYYQCDQCQKVILEGIEDGLLVFCNEDCRHSYRVKSGLEREHSSKARTSVSKSEDGGSSPSAPANIPDEACEHAVSQIVAPLEDEELRSVITRILKKDWHLRGRRGDQP